MTKITKGQIITIIGILVLILALPVAIFLTGRKQDIRPKAALAGKANFLLTTDSTKSSVGKNIIVYVSMQLTDANLRASGVDFTLLYDKEKLEVGQITPALTIYNPQAAFTDALIVTSGGQFPKGTAECPDIEVDCPYYFLRVAEVAKKVNNALPKGTITLAKITFRGKAEGQATIKFPDDNKYIQVVGTGTYVPPTAGPTCIIPPDCIHGEKQPDGSIVYCDPAPGIVYCSVSGYPGPTCTVRATCVGDLAKCVIPPAPSGGWCSSDNNPSPTCVPPPSCLTAEPPCDLPRPPSGWCPSDGI